MADKTSRKSVQLVHTFPADRRQRCGVMFVKGESKVLDLTKEQLEAFNDDPYFNISKPTAAQEAEVANAQQRDTPLEPTDGDPEGDADDETTPDETDDTDEEETPVSEATLEDLVRDNSKDELLEMAKSEGVSQTFDEKATKPQIAGAILANRNGA
jgi:hypothetical protein